MGLRLLTILILLIQPGWLVAARNAGAGCGVSACCVAEVTTSCCGERVVETVCRHTGGACLCASPGEAPRPEDAPAPRTERDAPEPRSVGGDMVSGEGPSDAGTPRSGLNAPAILAGRTHNEVQALLGIWLT